jgi:hypothetical protein
MASAVLSNTIGTYLVDAIATRGVKTLQELAKEQRLAPGAQFIYNGHVYGKGFAASNKGSALRLTETLDEPLRGVKLVFDFSKSGLVNATAYTRLSGSTRLFAFGYIAEVDSQTIHAIPYVIGDLVERSGPLPMPFAQWQEIAPQAVKQFAGIATDWTPSRSEFERMRRIPERVVKEVVADLLGELHVPKDWGGEEADLFSGNLLLNGRRCTGAFLLKGPAVFRAMTPADCGKNGDQIYRLFNIPADIYVIQHCHNIGAAVRKIVEALALHRAFVVPCYYCFMDGMATARLLRAHGRWPRR